VPDLRGYGGSDRPPRVEDYGIVDLAADVDGIATALGHDDYAAGHPRLGRHRRLARGSTTTSNRSSAAGSGEG